MVQILSLVLDTNVLISAALSAQGAPAQLLRLVLQDHRLVFSQPTFDELHTRLYRPKFDRYLTLELRFREKWRIAVAQVRLQVGQQLVHPGWRPVDREAWIAR